MISSLCNHPVPVFQFSEYAPFRSGKVAQLNCQKKALVQYNGPPTGVLNVYSQEKILSNYKLSCSCPILSEQTLKLSCAQESSTSVTLLTCAQAIVSYLRNHLQDN
jgi:hypothetical protein